MSEQAMEEASVALTPRLSFDKDADEEVPQFLRNDHKLRQRVKEPEAPAVVEEPKRTETLLFPEGNTPAVGKIQEEVPIDKPKSEPVLEDNTAVEQEVEAVEDIDGEGSSDKGSGDLDEMSVEELQNLEEEAKRKIEEKRLAQKKAIIDQIKTVVDMYKIPIDELVDALGGLKVKRKGVKAVQKYMDPSTGATWSGRGKEPAWIKGKDRKPFLIE